MSDYTETVTKLRDVYRAYVVTGNEKAGRFLTDAADAIEELQQIADHYEQTAKDYWKEACEYKAQLPKLGEWIVKGANRIDCSVCGHSICFASVLRKGSLTGYNYCPNCGADMRKMEVQE